MTRVARRWPVPVRLRRWLPLVAVVVLLGEMAAAMVTTAVRQTPTIDEPVYVGTTVVYTRQHSLRYNPEHPPLGKLVMGLGLAFTDVRLDPEFNGRQEALGQRVLYGSGNDPWRLMLLARLPVIVVTLLFGLVVFLFARDLTGPAGGLLALAVYAFSPDVIAHGSLATLDVPAAGFLLTSVWCLWRARLRPVRYLPWAGLALGAALATKMSALAAVPVLLGLVVLSVWSARRGRDDTDSRHGGHERGDTDSRHGGHERDDTDLRHGGDRRGGWAARLGLGVAAAAGVAAVAVAVVWLSYLAVDPALRWSTPNGVPVVTGPRGVVTEWLPFPRPYRDGMRVQFGFEDATFGGFLFGRSYHGSLWYYLPAVLLVKTPLGALALWLAGSVSMAVVPRLRRAAPYLLVPTVVSLIAAMTGARNFGVRYVIFVPMFLAVVAAGVTALAAAPTATAAAPTATRAAADTVSRAVATRRRLVAAGAVALVLAIAVSSLRTFPYYLPYANEAFGGPAKTHRLLHDSNVDWGQDLGRLADRLRQRYPGERVWLVYKGSGVPSYYGIEAANPLDTHPDRVRGLLVVSNSSVARADARLAALLDGSQPIDQVGYSITIFRRPGPAG